MSAGPAALLSVSGTGSPDVSHEGSVWRAPLVPVSLAFTGGILIDRLATVPLLGSLVAALVLLGAFGAALRGRSPGLPLVYLALALTGFGAAYHHYRRDVHPPDDIGWLIDEGRHIVQVRGYLEGEPITRVRPNDDPLLLVRPGTESSLITTAVVVLREVRVGDDWVPVSGRAQLRCGPLSSLHAGDEVECVGRLEPLPKPENPGEGDHLIELADAGIRAVMRVQHSASAITRLGTAPATSLAAALARIRGWGVAVLQQHLSEHQAGLAAALLLGENTVLPARDWDRYIQSGVIHVLVVSGQQLVVLGGFVYCWLRVARRRQRTSLVLVVVFLWGYALLAGGRPSVVRAATTFTVLAGGVLLRRPALTLNALAAAWIFVLLLNPCDVNNLGCLASFLCVAALYWIAQREQAATAEVDPLDTLIEESRPLWQRVLRAVGRFVLLNYLVSLLLWIAVTPLVASRMHYVPVAALLIGPPVVWLASLALVAGFLLLLAALVLPLLVPLFAWLTAVPLLACDALVDVGVLLWQRQGYVSGPPVWWLIGFYLLLAAVVLLPERWRSRRAAGCAGLSWLSLLLVSSLSGKRSDEMRMTFLAIGHGGCTVLETPDGRVLLYDAGSMRGPGITRSRIAPFLWSRGITRIDELFLSHADLDHFNGVRDLLERFPIGLITCTPSFDQKDNRPVRHIVEQIEKQGVRIRIVTRGDRLTAGDVSLDVLHPPAEGPEGNENVRSLVLLVQHGRHRFLLTGDLEGPGLEDVQRTALAVDVLMAPHHGSQRLDAQELMKRARPALVVSCQGQKPSSATPADYRGPGVSFLGTWPHGAITVRSHASGLIVETFVTKERLVLRSVPRASD